MAKRRLNLFEIGSSYDEIKKYLLDFFEQWSLEVAESEPIFQIEGQQLEKIARDLAHHQAFYAQRFTEARALVKWLEIEKAQKEMRHVKNYNNNSRALGVKEQSIYVAGERDVVEFSQLIVEANLRQQQFEQIVDALKQMGWMVGNIVKLKVAELNDIVL